MVLLGNKPRMIPSKIGFVKRFRLRLSIVSRHSANVELQIVRLLGTFYNVVFTKSPWVSW